MTTTFHEKAGKTFQVFKTAAISLLLAALSGCVSKSKADAQARMAYLAGQNAAMAQARMQQQQQMQQLAEPHVTVVGAVRNPIVAWSQDLTLARALVVAGYDSQDDPTAILIHRGEQEIQVDPQRLLNGEDFPLESGDIVQIQN